MSATQRASGFSGDRVLQTSTRDSIQDTCKRISTLLNGTIFYGVLLLIVLTAVPYGTVDPWWESIFEFVVFGLTILWLVEGSLTGVWFGREHLILLPLLAVVLFAVVQTLPLGTLEFTHALGDVRAKRTISADPFETWRFAFKLLALTLTLGLLLRYGSTARRLHTLAYVLIAVGVASALFGLLRSHLPEPLLTTVNSHLPVRQSYGQLKNRNHFALLMEMTIGLVLGLGIADRRRWKRVALYASLGLILWTALLLTHSRGGVLALLLEVVFLFLLIRATRTVFKSANVGPEIPKRARARRLVTSVVALAMIIAAVWASVVLIGGDETIGRFELTPDEFASHTNSPPRLLRPQIWQATLGLIKENAFVGVGFAGYTTAITRYVNASGQWTLEEAHNDYLELIASGGVVAAALGIWFFTFFIRLSTDRLKKSAVYDRALICGALASLFAVAVHSLFDFGLHIMVNSFLCAGLITLVIKTGPPSPSR